MSSGIRIVLTTTDTLGEAQQLARQLVSGRLAACVQIVKGIQSIYLWDGVIQDSTEYMVLIKTHESRRVALMELLETQHSYAVPEILCLDVVDVSTRYAQWLKALISQ